MRVAAIQYRPPKGQPDVARLNIGRLLDEAGQRGATLAVLPEMATTGYVWSSAQELAPHAEPAMGPTAAMLSTVARSHGMWVVCGFAERRRLPGQLGASGRPLATLHNSALVVSPAGEIVTCYRKMLLFDADLSWATPGWRRSIVPMGDGLRMAPAICMDINDPAFVGFLRAQQPEVFSFCTNWVDESVPVLPYWRERLRGWSGVFVAANTWGTDEGITFSGRSMVMGPAGRVLAEAPYEGDCVLIGDVAGR